MAASTTPITGKTGAIKYGATPTALAEFKNWKVSPKVGVIDTTAFGNASNSTREKISAGYVEGTVSADGNFTKAAYDALLTLMKAGAPVPFEFITEVVATVEYGYGADCIISGLPIETSFDGLITCSIEAELAGDFAPLAEA
jgi:hypothetical protein